MSTVTIIVDERQMDVEEGRLLIEILLDRGINIPYFCYHEALGAAGNCRMCMVEIEGKKRPQIACDTPVEEGMIVHTQSQMIKEVRQKILEMELINHPVDCPICDQAGECSLQNFYMDYGLYDGRIDKNEKVHHQKHLDLGSNVILDQERCVLCARCTRFTADITKTHELGIVDRGDGAVVTTMPGRKLNNDYAMNVVDLCPVGALTSKDFRFKQRVWLLKSTPSVCHGCAKGCSIYIDHNRQKYKDDTIYRFRPRKNPEVNGHFICDEGRLSYKDLQMNRQRAAKLGDKTISLETALNRMRDMIEESEGKILILADANLYKEELELIQAFSNKIGAQLASLLEYYRDESFADEWLRSSMRAANASSVLQLGIETEILPNHEGYGLLININHPDTKSILAKRRIDFTIHTGAPGELILPLAPFTESSGTMINEDSIVQYCEQEIFHTEQVPSLTKWLEAYELDKRSIL